MACNPHPVLQAVHNGCWDEKGLVIVGKAADLITTGDKNIKTLWHPVVLDPLCCSDNPPVLLRHPDDEAPHCCTLGCVGEQTRQFSATTGPRRPRQLCNWAPLKPLII